MPNTMNTAAKIKRPRRRTFYRIFDPEKNAYMCAGYNCKDLESLTHSFLSFTNIYYSDRYAKRLMRTGIEEHLKYMGLTLEKSDRILPFPKSHVYN